MRKFLSGIIAAAICLSLSAPALAATGYSSGTVSNTTNSSSNINKNPSTSQVSNKAQSVINNAVSSGSSTAVVSFQNIATLSADAIKAVAAKATAAKVSAAIVIDKVEGKAVVSRWYIDPAKAAALTGKINFEVNTDAKSIAATKNLVDKHYANTASVVSLGQKGSYGMAMDLAVKVDLTNLNTKALLFYSYDKATNSFKAITAPQYFIDSKGYLHFTTSIGGDIVITDSILSKK